MGQIFFAFLKMGLTSFGGPIAHLGFFHGEFVDRRKWIGPQEYADLLALCQFLPGPASSQMAMAIGFYRGGFWGAILAWVGFTLPSALLMILFAVTMNSLTGIWGDSWLHGLKIAAAAVVALAVWDLTKKFCTTWGKVTLAILTAVGCWYFQGPWVQVLFISIGAAIGMLVFKANEVTPPLSLKREPNFNFSAIFMGLFFVLLLALPILASQFDSVAVKLASAFYRVGALVFGGGHVVLPLIQSEVVQPGWVAPEAFLAGYGAAQAIPGPLFSVAAFLGFVGDGWRGAAISLVMIFLPSLLLIVGLLPYWNKIKSHGQIRMALAGVNAVVVGLLLFALYKPVGVTAILSWKDLALAALGFLILFYRKAPVYVVVLGLAVATAFSA